MSSADFDLFKISDEHQMLRGVVRDMVTEKITPYATEVDEKARFPREAYAALKELDLHAPHIPEEYGGAGADALAVCIVIEEVSRGCVSSSLIPAVNKLGTVPWLLAASEEIKQKYFPPIARGEAMAAYGLSEREAGSDTSGMTCLAERKGDEWVLNGHKAWITNAGEADYYTVMAVTDPNGRRGANISAFVVEKTDPGFTFSAKERKLGIKGSPTRELIFEDCVIPDDRRVGELGEGLKIALRTLDHTRITIGAQAVGVAQGALDAALAYVKDRKQFGKAIAEFQGVQFMLADMGMKLEAARQLVYTAAAKSERNDADLGYLGAAAKCFASYGRDGDLCRRVHAEKGGYTRDFPVERMMRDAKITQIYEGTNQVQRIVMARHLLR